MLNMAVSQTIVGIHQCKHKYVTLYGFALIDEKISQSHTGNDRTLIVGCCYLPNREYIYTIYSDNQEVFQEKI